MSQNSGFIALHRSDQTWSLLLEDPQGFHLLAWIALRARYQRSRDLTLGIDYQEACIGDWKNLGATSKSTYHRTKKRLAKNGFITFRGMRRGTIAKILDVGLFSITVSGPSSKNGWVRLRRSPLTTRLLRESPDGFRLLASVALNARFSINSRGTELGLYESRVLDWRDLNFSSKSKWDEAQQILQDWEIIKCRDDNQSTIAQIYNDEIFDLHVIPSEEAALRGSKWRRDAIAWINSMDENWNGEVLSSAETKAYEAVREIVEGLSDMDRAAIASYVRFRRAQENTWPRSRCEVLECFEEILCSANWWQESPGSRTPLESGNESTAFTRV